MSANQARFRVATMARVLGVSTSGYYEWRRRPPSARAQSDADLTARVRAIHGDNRGTYGAPRNHAELAEAGVAVGRKRVTRVMRAAGIAVVGFRETFTRVRPPSALMPSTSSTYSPALLDVVQGARAVHLWGALGWQDIRQRYRRSKLGPFWLTISMGVLVGALGTLYAGLFDIEVAVYLPFVTIGFVVWGLISGLITDGCTAFINAESIIKQVSLPLSVHVYRVVWRTLIIFAHNAVIFVVVAILFSIRPGWAGLLALPAVALFCLNGVWVGLLLGLLSARYRDVPQLVASFVQVTFFLTPIIWQPELLTGRAFMLHFNPFFHFLELVRAPALGQIPEPASWLAALGVTLVGWLATLVLFCRYRWRIAYWL